MAGAGQPQGIALSGEEEFAQSLLEGINTVAYSKSFVTRKLPKAKAQPAKPVTAGVESGAGAATAEGAAAGAIGAGVGTSRETSGKRKQVLPLTHLRAVSGEPLFFFFFWSNSM